MTLVAPIRLPVRPAGRISLRAQAAWEAEVATFRRWMQKIVRDLGFAPVSRSWLYLMEDAKIITKGDFDQATRWLAKTRKTLGQDGQPLLPLSLVAADDTRSMGGYDLYDREETPREYINRLIRNLSDQARQYWPASFWKFQSYYPIIWVEKRDLLKLFEPEIPRAVKRFAGKGWADVNSKAEVIRQIVWARENCLEPVILYCGDLDPVGVAISDHIRNNLREMANVMKPEWIEARGYNSPWNDPMANAMQAVLTGQADDLFNIENLAINRFGLNADFIEENDLLMIDGLETGSGKDLADPNHPDHWKPHVQSYLAEHGPRKCEANALVTRPDAARNLMAEALADYIDEDGIEDWEAENKRASEEATEHIEHFIKMLTFIDAQGWLFSGHKIAAAAEAHREKQQGQLPPAIDLN